MLRIYLSSHNVRLTSDPLQIHPSLRLFNRAYVHRILETNPLVNLNHANPELHTINWQCVIVAITRLTTLVFFSQPRLSLAKSDIYYDDKTISYQHVVVAASNMMQLNSELA